MHIYLNLTPDSGVVASNAAVLTLSDCCSKRFANAEVDRNKCKEINDHNYHGDASNTPPSLKQITFPLRSWRRRFLIDIFYPCLVELI